MIFLCFTAQENTENLDLGVQSMYVDKHLCLDPLNNNDALQNLIYAIV